jgi:hypothetical protein
VENRRNLKEGDPRRRWIFGWYLPTFVEFLDWAEINCNWLFQTIFVPSLWLRKRICKRRQRIHIRDRIAEVGAIAERARQAVGPGPEYPGLKVTRTEGGEIVGGERLPSMDLGERKSLWNFAKTDFTTLVGWRQGLENEIMRREMVEEARARAVWLEREGQARKLMLEAARRREEKKE